MIFARRCAALGCDRLAPMVNVGGRYVCWHCYIKTRETIPPHLVFKKPSLLVRLRRRLWLFKERHPRIALALFILYMLFFLTVQLHPWMPPSVRLY